jgi:hypothetical protein
VEKIRSMREVAVGMGTDETNTKILSNSSMSPAGCSKIKSWSLSLEYFYKDNIYVFKCFFWGACDQDLKKFCCWTGNRLGLCHFFVSSAILLGIMCFV